MHFTSLAPLSVQRQNFYKSTTGHHEQRLAALWALYGYLRTHLPKISKLIENTINLNYELSSVFLLGHDY